MSLNASFNPIAGISRTSALKLILYFAEPAGAGATASCHSRDTAIIEWLPQLRQASCGLLVIKSQFAQYTAWTRDTAFRYRLSPPATRGNSSKKPAPQNLDRDDGIVQSHATQRIAPTIRPQGAVSTQMMTRKAKPNRRNIETPTRGEATAAYRHATPSQEPGAKPAVPKIRMSSDNFLGLRCLKAGHAKWY